jgi:hypothetical protein
MAFQLRFGEMNSAKLTIARLSSLATWNPSMDCLSRVFSNILLRQKRPFIDSDVHYLEIGTQVAFIPSSSKRLKSRE